jgi:phage shock protein PspC (stress-responsive transcriptional regulator)
MNTVHDWFRRQGLVRPRHDRVLAGVCAGLGRRVGIDPWPARLLFLLLILALHGSVILAYVILWILMPAEESAAETMGAEPPSVYPTA